MAAAKPKLPGTVEPPPIYHPPVQPAPPGYYSQPPPPPGQFGAGYAQPVQQQPLLGQPQFHQAPSPPYHHQHTHVVQHSKQNSGRVP